VDSGTAFSEEVMLVVLIGIKLLTRYRSTSKLLSVLNNVNAGEQCQRIDEVNLLLFVCNGEF
jgi:hypothetical protein